MCSLLSDVDVDLVVQGQIGQDREYLANHDWILDIPLKQVEHDVSDVQFLQLNEKVLVIGRDYRQADYYRHQQSLLLANLYVIYEL